MSGFQPGTAAVPSTQVEISVSCRNLRDKDTFSKSDPVCVLFTWDVKSSRYHEFGRTDMVKDSLNPDFVKKFIMNYFFEESQKLKFEIYDVDSPSSRLDAHDFLGRLECTLGEIVGCGSGHLDRNLIGLQGGQRNPSKIIVRTEEVSSSKEVISMQLRATGLDKKDFLGKSDPFLLFYRANGDGSYTVVHKTEVIKNTLNPTWAPIKNMSVRTLCNGDHKRAIKIECFDWDSDGSHDLIGEFTTTLDGIINAPKAHTMFEVINPKKKAKKRNYKHSGELMVMTCTVEEIPTFLDFIQGGMEMNFTVAIDFTASNGNPSQPNSLHYRDPHQMNQYAAAIQSIAEIIQDYDTDKLFPVLGFGARLPDGQVSHEFPCNFNPNNPHCAGIQGIMQAYFNALQHVQLYGPTNFSPVIDHVIRFASEKRDGSNYFVLLIITDGVISDMNYTINAIIRASSLPMSIIIVGVGGAEFDAMDQLDADGKRLGIDGKYAERDIVQFVPFRDFMGRGHMAMSQAALAKAVLAEVPDQLVGFMRKRGYKPKPRRQPPPAGAPSQQGYSQGGPQQGVGQGGPQGAGQGGYTGAPGGAPPAQGYPQGAPQGAGQGGYPGGAPGGAPPAQGYPQGAPQGAGQGGYPGGAPQGYGQGGGAPPYPQSGGSSQSPYPQGGQASAPYPSGQSPYPAGAPTGQGAGQGSAPYPQGAPSGQPPYPSGAPTGQGAGQGSAPYPQGAPSGQPPYPSGAPAGAGQGSAPYPQGQPPPRPAPTYQQR